MEWSPAVVCLIGAGLSLALPPAFSTMTSKPSPRPPRLIGCEFMYRGNVTCSWEPGDTAATNYTVQIQRTPRNGSLKTFACTTPDTNCTVGLDGSTVRIIFCITITAHTGSRNISSLPRCQPGRTEVILPPAILNSVNPVRDSSQCLNVSWDRILSDFPVSDSEIEDGNLNSQIEFTVQDQLDVRIRNVPVKGYRIWVCDLRPDTLYIIRLRHRYQGPASPWSPWSNALQGRTGEDAPSAAPVFWRQVKRTKRDGCRFISLLWKPLSHSLANGRVLFYNVTCQTESAQVLSDHGSCRDLQHSSTSCSLFLPAGRCSCTLTASTSAGTSPPAQMLLPAASEIEPPSPSHIAVRPLDDSSIEVNWTAPVKQPVSGFVVEWFAVREENSGILHWEKLNSSCTTLVITEGVKPMERYAVSVKALYGERDVGKNRTLQIYTRQGTPSAGPVVKVQRIFGSSVELSWKNVPVELLRGFICNYSLFYTATNQPARSVFVPGHAHRYTLENLTPGNYDIFMRANTDAGTGAAGTRTNVHIGSEEISILMYVILPLMLTSLALVLMAFLAQSKMVKQKLCRDVPDPSNSSLSHWNPRAYLEGMGHPVVPEKPEVKYSEVILLGELQNSDPDEDPSYQRVQTYSPALHSPLQVRVSEKAFTRTSTKAKTTSIHDLPTCPSIYSSILFPERPPSYRNHPNAWQRSTVSISNGTMEPPGSHLTPAEEQKSLSVCLQQRQSPFSFSNFGNMSHSAVLLSHSPEVASPKHPISFNSSLSLRPNTSTLPSDSFPASFSPFPPSVFVDFSYCPVECDPYISSD